MPHSNFQSLSHTHSDREREIHLYKNLHCFNFPPFDYDAIGQKSATHTRAQIIGSNRNWMVLSIKYIILHNLWSSKCVCVCERKGKNLI